LVPVTEFPNLIASGVPTMKLETKTEVNVKQAVSFFRVTGIEKSVRYDVDGLGFEMPTLHGRT
jgi:hypothetical protein